MAEYYNFNTNITYVDATNKKLHTSSEFRIIEVASWMDGGSLTILCEDTFGSRYNVEFHQSMNLESKQKLAGRMYLDDVLIEERSKDEKILLLLLEKAIFKDKIMNFNKNLVINKIKYLKSDLFVSTNQKVKKLHSK